MSSDSPPAAEAQVENPATTEPRAAEPAEPIPFAEDEFRAWRGFMRVHHTVTTELGRRLEREHGVKLLQYAVLVTLVTAPDRRLRMTDLAEQVLTSPSGMTRAVARLAEEGLVERQRDPADGRSVIVSMTPAGLARLRELQVTHHNCVRELLFGGMRGDDLKRLATIYEHAMPGVLDAPAWSPDSFRRTAAAASADGDRPSHPPPAEA